MEVPLETLVNLELSVAEIEVILSALDELPRKVGNSTFVKVFNQTNEQVAPQTDEAPQDDPNDPEQQKE